MNSKDNFIIELTTFFILMGILNNIEGMGIFRTLSVTMLMVIGTFFLMIGIFKGKKIKRSHFKILFTYLIFLTIYFIGFLIYPQIVSIKVFLQAFGLINFFLFFLSVDYSKCKFKVMKIGISLYIIIFFLIKINIINYERFWRMYMLYPFLMIYFLAVLYQKEHKKIYIIMMAILALILININSRAVMLMILISILTYLFWKSIIKSKVRYMLFLLLTYILIFSFINIYISWYSNPNEISLAINEFSQERFGKNLYSGRQILWLNILDEIRDKWIWGHGTGVSAGELLEVGVSVHNLYLQLLVQNGVLGLVSFLILLFSIWMLFWKSRNNFITRLSASFFIASIIHNTFELILLQNHMAMAFFQWFIFSIGASTTTYNSNKDVFDGTQTKKSGG